MNKLNTKEVNITFFSSDLFPGPGITLTSHRRGKEIWEIFLYKLGNCANAVLHVRKERRVLQ